MSNTISDLRFSSWKDLVIEDDKMIRLSRNVNSVIATQPKFVSKYGVGLLER